MPDLLVYDSVYQPTSVASINPVAAPGFAGIATLVAQANGFLLATWAAATSPIAPIVYDIYIQASAATGLFVGANLVQSSAGTQSFISQTALGALLVAGTNYFVGVRARDPQGNFSTSLVSLSAVSSGVAAGAPLTTSEIATIVSGVWDKARSAHVAVGSFGEAVDAKISTRADQTTVATINTKIGTPAANISADIAAAKVDTAAIKVKTDQLAFTGGNVNARANVVADKTGYELSGAATNLIADLVWEALRGSHFNPGTFGEALQGVISAVRASYLDNLPNLDVATSTLATAASVSGIQNNTNFVGIVPPVLVLPATGGPQKDYLISAMTFGADGSPKDPDNGKMFLEIVDQGGSPIVSQFNMTGVGTGQFEFTYSVVDTDPERILYFRFQYDMNSVTFKQIRIGEVQEFETKLDGLIIGMNDLLNRLTTGRALNLDNLDGQVSLLQTLAVAATQFGTLQTAIGTRASQASVAALPTAPQISAATWAENINAIASGQNAARQLRDAKIFSQIDF